MRRTSSTRPSRLAPCLASVLVALVGGGAAGAAVCLPPVFEGGRRLHDRFDERVVWLEPMLRQHQVCWREPGREGELRVFIIGNSAVYGFPLIEPFTLSAFMNSRFAKGGPPAHFFNLGHVFSYQAKDALILREALHYRPDAILYALTLDDFRDLVPGDEWAEAIQEFFAGNSAATRAFADERPPGLAERIERHRELLPESEAPLSRLRQLGRLARVAFRLRARELRGVLDAEPGADKGVPKRAFDVMVIEAELRKQQLDYDCDEVAAEYAESFSDWKKDNVLAYLESVEATTGVPVVVLNWPAAKNPIGRCYNARYTFDELAKYNDWLRREARLRGLDLLDLHDFLPQEEFFDTLHPRPEGHRKIADEIQGPVRELLRQTRLQRLQRQMRRAGGS